MAGRYLGQRALHSLVALIGLIFLVFFLARLTGDPTNLYLPLDASLETREEFNHPFFWAPFVLLGKWDTAWNNNAAA